MKNRKDDASSRPDKDNPEWTRADIKKARPALDLVTEVFGEQASAELRRGRGRPPKADRKVRRQGRPQNSHDRPLEFGQFGSRELRRPIATALWQHVSGPESSGVRRAYPSTSHREWQD